MMMMKMMMNKDEDDDDDDEDMYDRMDSGDMFDMMDKMKMKMMMMKMMMNKDEDDDDDEDMYDRMDSGDMFAKMYKMKSEMNKMRSSQEKPWEKMMAQMRFRRDADDSLALNDRLKEKLEGQMKEHMNKISNMTCVLRELNVIDSRNNIDIAAMKADAQNKYRCQVNGSKKNISPSLTVAMRLLRTSPLISITCSMFLTKTPPSRTLARSRAS